MALISRLSGRHLREAYKWLVSKNTLNESHKKGLLSLIHMNALTTSAVTDMINSDDDIIRKYGAIAASKLYESNPEIINGAVDAEDLDRIFEN